MIANQPHHLTIAHMTHYRVLKLSTSQTPAQTKMEKKSKTDRERERASEPDKPALLALSSLTPAECHYAACTHTRTEHIHGEILSISTNLADLALLHLSSGLPFRRPFLLVLGFD